MNANRRGHSVIELQRVVNPREMTPEIDTDHVELNTIRRAACEGLVAGASHPALLHRRFNDLRERPKAVASAAVALLRAPSA